MAREVIFRIYDSFDNFLGWKADSFWSLTEKRGEAEKYPLEDSKKDSHLVEDLLYCLNNEFHADDEGRKGKPLDKPYQCGEFDEKRMMYIVPEQIGSDKPLCEIKGKETLPRIVISRGKDGRYAVE